MPLVDLVNSIVALHLLDRHARLPWELIDFLNLVGTHDRAPEDAVIGTVRYLFTVSGHHDLRFVPLVHGMLIRRWVLLDVGASCVGRHPDVIVMKHSWAFGVSPPRLIIKSILLLDATALEATAVDLGASDIR